MKKIQIKQLLTISSLTLFTLGAQAATITIGGQAKNTTGTLLTVNQGDISCYLELRDDAGKVFHESGSFELCNNKLKGQRVQLGYSMQNVQASSCQGDPSCKKSERIALVTSMRPALAATAATATANGNTFCTSQETVVFACDAGGKRVSVCASRQITPKSGYLQYRFGTPGKPLEITLPEGEVPPTRAAYGAFDGYAGGGASWMRFRKGTYSYVVYGGVGRWGPNGATMEKQGIAVENNGKVIANLKCNRRNEGELGPQWLESTGFKRNDREEFLIPE